MNNSIIYLSGMTILNVRLKNARKLAATVGGHQKFADRMNMSRQQASHVIGKNPHKGIGHSMARRIEQVFAVPVGWLDIDHDTPALVHEDAVEVPLLSGTVTTSTHSMPSVAEEVIRRALISKNWIRLNVQATAFEYLALISSRGDSMEPTFADGSILLVDRGISSVKIDGVFVLSRGDELFIKRVQRNIDGGLTIRSDNPHYDAVTVDKQAAETIAVLGRVLVAWNPKKL